MATPLRPQAHFNDLYSTVYRILDDAKETHDVVKLYKGSHAAANPHPVVTDFGQFFFRERRGLIAYACSQATTAGRSAIEDLDSFDLAHRPARQRQDHNE